MPQVVVYRRICVTALSCWSYACRTVLYTSSFNWLVSVQSAIVFSFDSVDIALLNITPLVLTYNENNTLMIHQNIRIRRNLFNSIFTKNLYVCM